MRSERRRLDVVRVLVVDDADRALEVAVVGDLDDRQAGVLLVVGAGAAVGRAAVLHLGGELQRLGARAGEGVGAHVVPRVLADQRLRGAAPAAVLLEVDLALADDDLGLQQGEARGAGGGGVLEEVVSIVIGHLAALHPGVQVCIRAVGDLGLGLATGGAELQGPDLALADDDSGLDVLAAALAARWLMVQEGVGLVRPALDHALDRCAARALHGASSGRRDSEHASRSHRATQVAASCLARAARLSRPLRRVVGRLARYALRRRRSFGREGPDSGPWRGPRALRPARPHHAPGAFGGGLRASSASRSRTTSSPTTSPVTP